MARLAVTPELILPAILHNAENLPRITGAAFDPATCTVVFDIEGEGIPAGDVQVKAEFTARRQEQVFLMEITNVTFKEVG